MIRTQDDSFSPDANRPEGGRQLGRAPSRAREQSPVIARKS